MMTYEEKQKEIREFEQMMNKYYDVEFSTYVEDDQLSFNKLKMKRTRIMRLKLVNVNGWGIGQAYFIDEDGAYVLLPWCYIISMIPAKEGRTC